MSSYYAHLRYVHAGVGQRVVRGTRVGLVGSSGISTGPHLHFELRRRGAAVDPLPALR
jgi:murein DD-endopeptidase MepM/ murein hydrolase activator NlpD